DRGGDKDARRGGNSRGRAQRRPRSARLGSLGRLARRTGGDGRGRQRRQGRQQLGVCILMHPPNPKVGLRPFLPDDTSALADIFRESISELTGEDYSGGQQRAWASAADEEEPFGHRLSRALTLVATLGGRPVGFASLADGSRIAMLYVHPRAARQGVATALL